MDFWISFLLKSLTLCIEEKFDGLESAVIGRQNKRSTDVRGRIGVAPQGHDEPLHGFQVPVSRGFGQLKVP